MVRKRRKPSIYLDTSVLSALHYDGRIESNIYRRLVTQEWWKKEHAFFDLYVSRVVEQELSRGAWLGKAKALAAVRRLAYLPLTREVRVCAASLLEGKIVPSEKINDAFQLAFSIVHEVDYLLSWNYAHLSNEVTRRVLWKMAESEGWRVPLLETPDSIPKVSEGQQVRRKV